MRYFIVMYYQTPNGKYTEQAKVADKIKKSDERLASVIIDYKDQKVVKSRFQNELAKDPKNFEKINNFYKQHYPDIIKQLEKKYEILEEALEIAKETLTKNEE